MPNIIASLNDHIRRLARREVRANTRSTKRSAAAHRRDIAALKRLLKALNSRMNSLEKNIPHRAPIGKDVPDNVRFRADGLRSHRARLGISAKDYGLLVGVSPLTIYNWEANKSRPRRRQLPALVATRRLGKREAAQRLAELR